jgi:hypothetical protein
MRYGFLVLALVVFATVSRPSLAAGQLLSLYEAARAGEVEAQGAGGPNGGLANLHIKVKNTTGRTQELLLLGTYFTPEHRSPASQSQREAVVRTPQRVGFERRFSVIPVRLGDPTRAEAEAAQGLIVIPPYGTWEGMVSAFCLDPHRPSPRAREPYRIVSTGVPPAIHEVLASWIRHPNVPQAEIQTKVWKTVKDQKLVFYEPAVQDVRKLRRWMRGQEAGRDAAELALKASKPGYWSSDLLAPWTLGTSVDRDRAKRVEAAWSAGRWLTDDDVKTLRSWMDRSPIFRDPVELAIKAALPSRWPPDMLDVWLTESTDRDRVKRILTAWAQEEGRTASPAEIAILERWVAGEASDRERAERVLEGSRPTYWPATVLGPWRQSAEEEKRLKRILGIWSGELKRPPAAEGER